MININFGKFFEIHFLKFTFLTKLIGVNFNIFREFIETGSINYF